MSLPTSAAAAGLPVPVLLTLLPIFVGARELIHALRQIALWTTRSSATQSPPVSRDDTGDKHKHCRTGREHKDGHHYRATDHNRAGCSAEQQRATKCSNH